MMTTFFRKQKVIQEQEATDNPHRAPLFERYQPSNRLSRAPIQQTQYSGWLTLGLATLLVWADPGAAPYFFYSIAGSALGMTLILRAALRLTQETQLRFHWAQRAAALQDRWFPGLLFFCQTVFLFAIASLLWFTLPMLGVTLHLGLHIGLYVLLTLISARRILTEWASVQSLSLRSPLQDSIQYVTIIIVTLLLAVAATHAISPFGHPITGDNSGPLVFIWLIAVFMVISCIILLIDRALGRKGR